MGTSVIASVRPEIVPDPYNPQLLVHVTTDDGTSGLGETWWGTYQPAATPGTPVAPIAAMIDAVLGPVCLGQPLDSVADIEALWQRLHRATVQYGFEGIASTAISGIDIAAWDLVARRQHRPVHALLGPIVHESLPVYASLTWLGDADRVCRDAERALAAGIRAVKLHEADVDLILEVRCRLGPAVPMMVDASARFDEAGAVAATERLAEADLVWFEEPIFPQSDHAALARLRSGAAMPIAAGENEFSVEGFERLISAGAIDILQPEIAKFGGLTPARRVGELAHTVGIPMYPHNYSLGPSLLANIHWAVTAPAACWLEVPWLSEGGTFPCGLEMPELVDGCVAVPTAPGLGFTRS